jgi:hypothetical protein
MNATTVLIIVLHGYTLICILMQSKYAKIPSIVDTIPLKNAKIHAAQNFKSMYTLKFKNFVKWLAIINIVLYYIKYWVFLSGVFSTFCMLE